ncbi:Variant-specific surface protein [Giardia duodenalis]|uniref:Variant-specific surface protein n=1 Tax=Giardia intestinalis TaxID=5741 RepID=V6TP69_GIAIN|nr:Variant-specific surface protein [Giardia intestinalis]
MLFMGGCYDTHAAPGSGVCREARDGVCGWYKEESIRGVRETEESRAHDTSAEARGPRVRVSAKTRTRGQTGSGQCSVGTNGCAECDSSNTACARCEAGKRLEGSQCVDGIGVPLGRGLTADPKQCTNSQQCSSSGNNCLDVTIGGSSKEVCTKCENTHVPIDGACQPKDAQSAICTAGTDTNQGTCTACLGSYYLYSGGCYATCPDGTYADSSAHKCTACDGTCNTCSGAGTDKCTSCSTAENYLKLTDSSDGTGECVAKGACGTAHFEVEADKKCYPCGDSAHSGVDGCTTCAFSQVSGQSTLTCSVCTPDTKKPNKEGSRCFVCSVDGCSNCRKDGVCEACDGNKVSSGGSSCVTNCPENSTGNENACICNSRFAPSGDSCAASSRQPQHGRHCMNIGG